jgi:hypothetical protein
MPGREASCLQLRIAYGMVQVGHQAGEIKVISAGYVFQGAKRRQSAAHASAFVMIEDRCRLRPPLQDLLDRHAAI